MFHIDKNGNRARCRAIVRACPLGGEPRLMEVTGVQGPARPTAPEAKEHGMYTTFYGEAVKKREEAAERKREREAQAAQSITEDGTATAEAPVETISDVERAAIAAQAAADQEAARRAEEYQQHRQAVQEIVAAFEQRHDTTLEHTSNQYFNARDKMNDTEQQYLDDLDGVGDKIQEMAAYHVDPEKVTIYEALEREQLDLELAIPDVRQEYYSRRKALREQVANEEISLGESMKQDHKYVHEGNQKLREITAQQQELNPRAARAYEAAYGQAYKKALHDVGVEFTDGAHRLHEMVSNVENNDIDFVAENEEALSYYPKSWSDNINVGLTIHKHRSPEAGYVRKYDDMYGPSKSEVHSGGYSVAVHEWGHVMEHSNPELGRAERLFLIQEKRHSSSKNIIKYCSKKNIASDSLIIPYSGVYYKGRSRDTDEFRGHSYEVLTTGAESLFTGKAGGWKPGADQKAARHRNFILGLFATQGKPTDD